MANDPQGTYVAYDGKPGSVRYGDKGAPGISSDDVANDSDVVGTNVSEALDALTAAIDAVVSIISAIGTDDVDNDSGVAGATCSDALDQLLSDLVTLSGTVTALEAFVLNLDSDQVDNASGVAGVTVSNSLDTLQAAITALQALINPSFGDMYEDKPGVPTNIVAALQNTFYPWISASQGVLDSGGNITFISDDIVGDYLEVGVDDGGRYLIAVSGAFSGTNNTTWEVYIFQNGVQTRIGTVRKLGVNGDVGSISASGILSLASGDLIRLKVQCTDAVGATFGLEHMDVAIERLGS